MIRKMITRMKLFQLLPLFLVLFFEHSPVAESGNTIRCIEKERQALLKLKNELINTNARLSSWGDEETKTDCCKWRGIHCHNRTNHVTRLDLRGPSESTYDPNPPLRGNLSNLLYLDLHDDYDCYSESLDWVSNLRLLEYLDLTIPSYLLPKINGSSSLAILDIPWNWYLTSPLTLISWFSNFSSRHKDINLNGDSMPGPIPNVFENMIFLQHLDLSGTDLEGGIPKYFGNMSSLMYLDLSANYLTGEFFELTKNLSGLIETINCGSIQDDYLQLPYLCVLDLSSNRIMGPVPDLSVSSSLKELLLEDNMFSGNLTESIGGLSKLEVLWIGSNFLEGIITEVHMLNLYQLRILDLSTNLFLTVKVNPD
ncbi:hypothetical protein BUALT_Bualt06G0103300 [Buddleja alternifolia]|uniref:Leucine-rich repeat-containing N-terminal plant-type domain-containing protein n=1 Tax=Buddleja alternifolia TaxID=168488 RepID=A0AAV6XFS3_9LAMI|nr:hypothetical protein BUALT_Bualt06G0103300 [Buddleja alternifolia]